MTIEAEIKELEKNCRLSAKALSTGLVWTVIGALVIMIFNLSKWIVVMYLAISAFTLVGDIMNWIYCRRKLRTLRLNAPTAEP